WRCVTGRRASSGSPPSWPRCRAGSDTAGHLALSPHQRNLAAGDDPEQKAPPIDAAQVLRAGKERRHDERGAVERREGVEVVALDALDEGAVEQRGGWAVRRLPPADDRLFAFTLEPGHGLDRETRPGKRRAGKGAADAVER